MGFAIYKGVSLESTLTTTATPVDQQLRIVTPRWILGGVPPDILSTLKRNVSGEKLTPQEKASVEQWINEYEQRIRLEAYDPKPTPLDLKPPTS